MASDAMMQAIERMERAVARAEDLAMRAAEERTQLLESKIATTSEDGGPESYGEIDPFSRDKAIAALKSLDALIGDLQKARSDA